MLYSNKFYIGITISKSLASSIKSPLILVIHETNGALFFDSNGLFLLSLILFALLLIPGVVTDYSNSNNRLVNRLDKSPSQY